MFFRPVLISLTIAFTFFNQNSFAAGYLTPLGQGVPINKYLLHAGGNMTIWVTNTSISNPDNCINTDRVHIKASLPGSKNMIAAIMTAFASGQKVGYYSTGCETTVFLGRTCYCTYHP